jgi:gliding motility-associated-like protein
VRAVFIFSIIFIFCFTKSKAQLCTGSLGDPIVNIAFTFPSGSPVPLGNPTTTYNYVTTTCPVDGSYTLTANTSSCFGDTWHSVLSDHTGVPNSYYMLINASNQPGDFYVDTVKNLCSNSTYEFAAWIMNVQKSTACGGVTIKPNITFSIERTNGTLIQSYNSNNIANTANPTWIQYGFFFTTPSGVSDVVLRMRNNAPGGCGNDLALDDITFRRCGPLVTPSIVGLNIFDAVVCEGTTRTFNLLATVSAGFANPEYQWQQSFNGSPFVDIAGANTLSFNAVFLPTSAIGVYDYRLAINEQGTGGVANCRILSKLLTFNLYQKPTVNIVGDTSLCIGQNILLTANSTATLFNWTGPNGFISNTNIATVNNAQIVHAGLYTLVAKNSFGCETTLSKTISISLKPQASVSFTDTTICKNVPIGLLASGGGTYNWFPATNISSTVIANPTVTTSETTLYKVEVTNQFACKDTASVQVNIVKLPVVDAGPNQVLIGNSVEQLNGSITGNYSNYFWTSVAPLSNANSLNPTAQILSDTKFYLTANSIKNCGSVTDSVEVNVFADIYIPNVFTPNGDGINDTWNIPALKAFPNHALKLYNRFGQMIFTSKAGFITWDGKYKAELQPTGTYTYVLDLKNGKPIFKGTVLLLR